MKNIIIIFLALLIPSYTYSNSQLIPPYKDSNILTMTIKDAKNDSGIVGATIIVTYKGDSTHTVVTGRGGQVSTTFEGSQENLVKINVTHPQYKTIESSDFKAGSIMGFTLSAVMTAEVPTSIQNSGSDRHDQIHYKFSGNELFISQNQVNEAARVRVYGIAGQELFRGILNNKAAQVFNLEGISDKIFSFL